MMIRRALAGVGRTLISIGFLLLLFVAYQLWGTGIQTRRLSKDAAADFAALLAEAEALPFDTSPVVPIETAPTEATPVETAATETTPATTPAPAPTTKAPATTKAPKATTKPPKVLTVPATKPGSTATTLPKPRLKQKKLALRPGQGVGRIQIKSIGMDWVFVEGTDRQSLKAGPGHYVRTPMPGQPGNAALACHRTTYEAPCYYLDRVPVGAEILIQTPQGVFKYVKTKQSIVPPKGPAASAVLAPSKENILTMTTCHPRNSARQRLVLHAKLVGPASADDFYIPSEPVKEAPPSADEVAAIGGVDAGEIGLEEADPSTVEETEPLDSLAFDTNPVSATATEPVASEASAVTAANGDELNGADDVIDTGDTTDAATTDLTLQTPHEGTGPVRSLFWFRGHQSVWLKMLGWAAVCAAIWTGAWMLARRRRWIAKGIIYGVGTIFLFLPALYFCYEQLAYLLPESV